MGDILIVDDEWDIWELILDILKDEGYSIWFVLNFDEVMEEVGVD